MRKGIWQLLIESFSAVYGLVAGVIGLLMGIVFYVFVPSEDVVVRVLAAILVVLFLAFAIIVATLLHALASLGRAGVLPQVRAGMAPFPGTGAAMVCVLDPSELFYVGIWVSFFRVTSQGIELPIGIGSVANVQQDGKILVEMARVFEEHGDFVERAKNNDAGALAEMRIKPYVPQQMFGSYRRWR